MSPINSAIIASILAITAAPGDVAPTPQPGQVKVFKDWSVGCDNAGDCQAISLVPQSGSSGFQDWGGPITVVRTSGREDILKIRALVQESEHDRYRMIVDGELIDTGPIVAGDYPIEIVGEDAIKVADAIARGLRLQITDGEGASLTSISLAGSKAALRYMDVQQKRVRTPTALVAKGRRNYRPLELSIPSIPVNQWSPAQRIPDTNEIVDLVENSACKDERFGVVEDQVYPMGQKDGTFRALVLVSCGSGAYNFSSTPYIGEISGDEKDGARWTFTPAEFDLQPGWGGDGPYPLLVNAQWDESRQILGSYAKGRGLGDCGNAESFIWDGEKFRLIEASRMNECRGAYQWITTWRAKVEQANEGEDKRAALN